MAAICVFCSGSPTAGAEFLELARRTGQRLAAGGHRLVYGGGGTGMMAALAAGAAAGGAPVLGIAPEGLLAREAAGEAGGEVRVVAGLAERKRQMTDEADAFLVLPGGLGTLDELFEVWTTGPQLGLHDRPVVLLDAGGFYGGLLTWLQGTATLGMITPGVLDAVTVAVTVEAAFGVIESGRVDAPLAPA